MPERPYTLLSCGMSIDGYLDGACGQRLVLSNEADLDRVDEVRAGCDAILVGAATVRNDNPRLLVRPGRAGPRRSPRPRADADQGDGHRAGRARPGRELLRHRRRARSWSTARSARWPRLARRLAPVATVVDGGQAVRDAAASARTSTPAACGG